MAKLPPRYIKQPTNALFNQKLSDAAYRLHGIILAYCWDTGECDLSNSDLAAIVGKSRQYIGKLLGELYSCQLLVEETLDDRRLIKPLNETYCQQASHSTDDGNYSLQNRENIVSPPPIVVEDINISSINNIPTTTTREAETPVYIDEKPEFTLDGDYAVITSQWQHLFGRISQIMSQDLSMYLDDKKLIAQCELTGDRPKDWILDAMRKTALAKPRNEQTLFTKIITSWINDGREDKTNDGQVTNNSNVTLPTARNADGSYNV